MSKKETPTGAATSVGAETEMTAGKASFSVFQCSTPQRGCQVAALLSPGKDNAVTRESLAAIFGADERALRRQIQTERKNGALILSDCKNGYYLPESPWDVVVFIRSMSHRAREISEISRAAERALSEMTGQGVLEGW